MCAFTLTAGCSAAPEASAADIGDAPSRFSDSSLRRPSQREIPAFILELLEKLGRWRRPPPPVPPAPPDEEPGGDADSGADGDADSDGGETPGVAERTSFFVENGRLYDPCGDEVILRGVNHPTMYEDRSGAALPEIASTGANAVRLFWFATHGVPISEIEPAIDAAVENGMVPMIELHDSTGTWNLEPLIEYWTSPEAIALIERHESHLLVNLANEASVSDDDVFEADTIDAIARLRAAGIRVPIVVDATGWGRNYNVLLDRGPAILEADPLENVIFSAHWYDPTPEGEVTAAFERARALRLPFIVGEFANRSPPGCGPEIPYIHLIREAERLGLGWLAWSWGNASPSSVFNADCSEFDMTVTHDASTLTGWGREVALDDVASIRETSLRTPFIENGTCE